jgi:hypothetical protein
MKKFMKREEKQAQNLKQRKNWGQRKQQDQGS